MRLKLLLAVWVCTITAYAQETYRFDFTGNPRKGYINSRRPMGKNRFSFL